MKAPQIRQRTWQRLWAHAPQLAAGVAAAIPVISSTVGAVRGGWVPAGDDGIIATRALDVLSAHTPLVGQYSEAGLLIKGQLMHSPGPMLYWLIALPARYGSVASIAVTMCAINVLAIVTAVALARRRGGLILMFATALGIALMCQSLPTEAMHDIWNPAAGLFPFLALIFIGWSVACGEYRLLPAGALVASFLVQTHLMYAAPTAVLLVVGCGGLLLHRLIRARAGARAEATLRVTAYSQAGSWPRVQPEPPTAQLGGAPSATARLGGARSATTQLGGARSATARLGGARSATAQMRGARSAVLPAGRVWPWALAALALTALCWVPPAIDQIEHNPGNLAMIVRTAEHSERQLGASVGWHAVVRSVGVRPWWLYVPASEWERKYDVLAKPTGAGTDSAIAILAALALVGAIGAIVRRFDLTAASLIGLGLCAAIAAQGAFNPASRLLAETLGYTMWWGSELGLWVWLIVAWALWLGLVAVTRPALRLLRLRISRSAPTDRRTGLARARPAAIARAQPAAIALGSLALLGGVIAVGDVVAHTDRPPSDSHSYEYRPIRKLASAIERAIPPGETIAYHFGALDIGTQPMEPAIRFFLVRHGDRPLADGSLPRLGPYYEQGHRHVQMTLYLADGTRRPPHMRLVGRVRFKSPWRREVLSAWVSKKVSGATPPTHGTIG